MGAGALGAGVLGAGVLGAGVLGAGAFEAGVFGGGVRTTGAGVRAGGGVGERSVAPESCSSELGDLALGLALEELARGGSSSESSSTIRGRAEDSEEEERLEREIGGIREKIVTDLDCRPLFLLSAGLSASLSLPLEGLRPRRPFSMESLDYKEIGKKITDLGPSSG